MNITIVKTLFYTVGLLTAFILNISYSSELSAVLEQEAIIIKRDNINSSIKEYETTIKTFNKEFLKLKKDVEWLDLKMVHIQDQHRIIPEKLIEARILLIEKQIFRNEKKQRLIERIQNQKITMSNLNKLIAKNKIGVESIFKLSDITIADTKITDAKIADIKIIDINNNKLFLTTNVEKELKNKILRMELQDWVELIKDNTGIRIEARLPILFASGTSTVNNAYQEFLKKIAKLTKPYDVLVHVKGFTDKLVSKQISNIDLGAKRAAKIVNQLVKYGMQPSVFKITSREDHKKSEHVKTTSNTLNRRAELTVFFKSS